MTETFRRFPRSMRAAVVCGALRARLRRHTRSPVPHPPGRRWSGREPAWSGSRTRSSGIRRQLAATQDLLNVATARVERRQGAVEKVSAELARTQEAVDRAHASYERISDPAERSRRRRVHERTRLQHRLPLERGKRGGSHRSDGLRRRAREGGRGAGGEGGEPQEPTRRPSRRSSRIDGPEVSLPSSWRGKRRGR